MDQQLTTPRRHRETSERLQKQITYSFVNRVNTFSKFYKTSEEKEKLKKIRAEHKIALKEHYGDGYNPRKTMNLPQFVYEITLST